MSLTMKNILKVAVIAVGAIAVAKKLPVVSDYV